MLRKEFRSLAFTGLLLFSVMLVAGCGINREPDWYVVTGSGVAPASSIEAQETLLAKRAAELDARRKLLETAKGTTVQSETTVQDFMTVKDNIRTKVYGVIRNAEIIDTRYYPDGICEVDMRLDMNRVKDAVR